MKEGLLYFVICQMYYEPLLGLSHLFCFFEGGGGGVADDFLLAGAGLFLAERDNSSFSFSIMRINISTRRLSS